MGKKSKKSHKKKSKKSKTSHRSRSRSRSVESTDSSTRSSSTSTDRQSPSRSSQSKKKHRHGDETKTSSNDVSSKKKETLEEFFNRNSNANYLLSQKSEMLMFDKAKESEEKNTEQFIWRKKNQKIGLDKLDPEKIVMLNKMKQEETAKELEKLKRRKIDREREREERDREREFLQRQKETEYHKEWEKQEDSFQLKQVKLRSKIRIEEGRAKPIDLLARYINAEEDDLAVEMHEPYTYLNGLNIRDLEDLIEDIKVYSDLEMGINGDYWKDITLVTEDELTKLQKLDKNSREHAGDRREGINQSVLQDVSTMFRGKNYEQLANLEKSIKNKVKNEAGIDIGYWESLLAQLKAHMARARLRDRHQKVLNDKLTTLRKQQGISDDKRIKQEPKERKKSKDKDEDEDEFEKRMNERIKREEAKLKEREEEGDNDDSFEMTEEMSQMAISLAEYENGNYSPVYLNPDDLSLTEVFIVTQAEDNDRLEFKRKQVLGSGYVKPELDEAFEAKARDRIQNEDEDNDDDDDAMVSKLASDDNQDTTKKSQTTEIALEHHYLWSDKYRPRKPRYYNRVHTGYDWNQYNKKHYDIDNPPPKTVQGYKFNVKFTLNF
jgi:hypothetical protein